MRLSKLDGNSLDLRLAILSNRRRRDAIEATGLVTNNEPATRIGTQVDPRTLLVLRHSVEQLDLEILERLDSIGGRGRSAERVWRSRLGGFRFLCPAIGTN